MSCSGKQNAVGKYNILLLVNLREQGMVTCLDTAVILVLPTESRFDCHSELTSVKIHDALYVKVVRVATLLQNHPQKNDFSLINLQQQIEIYHVKVMIITIKCTCLK